MKMSLLHNAQWGLCILVVLCVCTMKSHILYTFQTSPVEKCREVVIRCLIVYLSENPENLIKHYQVSI